jgi:hypothetical protein
VKRQIEVEQLKRKQVQELKQNELEMAKSHILAWSTKMESKQLEKRNSNSTLDIEEIEDLIIDENEDDIESSDSDVDVEQIRESLRSKKLIPEIPEVRGGLDQTTSNVHLKFTSRGLIPTNTARETEDGIIILTSKMALSN